MFGLKELRAAAAKAAKMTEALVALGIDPEADDLKAAISEKFAGASSASVDLVAKAGYWDKLAAQAASLKIDPMAAISSDAALEAMIDSAARELLADHVKESSAQTADHREPTQSAPAGFAISAQWEKLCADAASDPTNAALAKVRDDFYAANQDQILANVNFTTPTK